MPPLARMVLPKYRKLCYTPVGPDLRVLLGAVHWVSWAAPCSHSCPFHRLRDLRFPQHLQWKQPSWAQRLTVLPGFPTLCPRRSPGGGLSAWDLGKSVSEAAWLV